MSHPALPGSSYFGPSFPSWWSPHGCFVFLPTLHDRSSYFWLLHNTFSSFLAVTCFSVSSRYSPFDKIDWNVLHSLLKLQHFSLPKLRVANILKHPSLFKHHFLVPVTERVLINHILILLILGPLVVSETSQRPRDLFTFVFPRR